MTRYDHQAVEQFVEDVFATTGAPPDIASNVASSLVAADLRGQHAQGVLRLEWILNKIDRGEIEPSARPGVDERTGAVAQIAGNSAIGQHVGTRAVELGAEMADDNGIGAVTMRNANDLGRVGEWAEIAAELGCVFIAMINAKGDRSVAPDGCAQPLLSTNPLTIGLPTFNALDFPIVLDMASSQVAYGQVMKRDASNETLPPEWTSSESGEPVLDPEAFLNDSEGILLPLGGRETGHKGFGLGIVNELAAGILSGGTVAGQPDLPPSGNDALFLFLDPHWFVAKGHLERQIRWFSDYLAAEPSDSEVRFPGEGSHRTRVDYEQNGIPLSPDTVTMLEKIASTYDIDGSTPSPLRE